MVYWNFFYFWLLIFELHGVLGLDVTHISVPEIVDFRDNVTLFCRYDISDQKLNSVKWYKDEKEFYRYAPFMKPSVMKFQVDGVDVQDGSCDEALCRVALTLLGAKSTGVYKCEVSGDAPLFRLAAKEDNMTVAALPQIDPLIENFHSMYRLDDYLSASCYSDYSSLPTKLTWYINGEPALPHDLHPSIDPSIAAHDYNLRRQRLQLNFSLSSPRFLHAGKLLELKCVAEIENFPELRRETTLTAVLNSYYDINNQMLIHSATKDGISHSAQTISSYFPIATSLSILFALIIF